MTTASAARSFADSASAGQLEDELRARIRGEVRFDERARSLYATDASPYEIRPVGVVVPRSTDDIRATVELCARHGVPLLPRGAGTSLAGQTVGRAVVLDVSKYLTRVLEVDVEARWARVEPGVVRDQLNADLAPHGLQFTPDISTTNRANIGGMVANNAAGTRSIKYGKTVDQVMAMRVLLMDGTELELGPLDAAALDAKRALQDREGELYRTVYDVTHGHADEIERRYPKVMRRVGGYNLDEFIGGRPFNLAKLVCGSEGTLAIILDVTVHLDPVPTHRLLAMLHFDTLEKALTAVRHVNRHGPSAVELMDRDIFVLGRRNHALAPLLGWLQGDPGAVLMVEFDGTSEAEMRAGLESLQRDDEVSGLAYATYVATAPAQQAEILQFRRDGLGIYSTVKGREKPTPFVEDSSVPVEHLPAYIAEVAEVCRRHGVHVVFYAHASVGVIHVRPHLDLKTEHGVDTFQAISREVFELVKKHGGSWSGEHGDGLIRSYQNPNLFGEVLYEDFRAIKHAFDPANLLNPGKVVDAPPMTQDLRYGPGYPEVALETFLDFSADGGYLGAIENCNGVGACRKVGTGTMCPSYMATRDEDHSTRGRANVLRDALNGRMPGGLTSRDVYDVLDLCLECKACSAECPSQVDMAKIKYEFLQHYYDDHGTPLSVQAIGNVARVAPLGQRLAPIGNALLPTAPVRWLLERVLQVDRRRVMPRYAPRRFDRWFARRARGAGVAAAADVASSGTAPRPAGRHVALFADTWTVFNDTGPGQAAVRVLEALGYQVELVPYGCCGRPQISKGLLRQAKTLARATIERLSPYVERGVPVVGLEPSCVTALTGDYRDLLPGARTDAVAADVFMFDQFLAKEWSRGELDLPAVFVKRPGRTLLHGHCQQKAILGTSSTRAVLEWVSEDVAELDSGCCGMAGSFGYGHHDLSMAIGEQRLFPAVREHDGDTVACGFSCRHQIADGTHMKAKHLSEVMAEALRERA
ncbi:MAG: FAD-linked oxidase C-terminal domain-containing protein [Deinococcales bacterium]